MNNRRGSGMIEVLTSAMFVAGVLGSIVALTTWGLRHATEKMMRAELVHIEELGSAKNESANSPCVTDYYQDKDGHVFSCLLVWDIMPMEATILLSYHHGYRFDPMHKLEKTWDTSSTLMKYPDGRTKFTY